MLEDNTNRKSLKTELIGQVEALSFEEAIFPEAEPVIDKIVEQLEEANPIVRPLSVENQLKMFGIWELIYASRGTVVTRKVAKIPDWTGIKIKRVWQNLTADDTEKINTSNCAQIELPFLGEWKVQADGVWKRNEDRKTALVSFNAFTFGLQKPFTLPELKIPVLEALRDEAVWITSYLDEEIRIGRGKTGNLFVFCRK
ncbi:PAP/fibrillin family protein [Mastigocoleus testarum]|uniref:PAP fibrillin n=1 Tax=Mastigocoleus testarum BC008 TaxID=371196 RepID=A0A0V7ZYE3_9CYAN|nr:PAP/fibrillin family protein [Mastigocoleus testarum]KST69377.1 PAP fibrillin [Mastigocoleus testarum BC008]KST69530.1 PAP fibrillin [Mastigocoleus testarum BC008]